MIEGLSFVHQSEFWPALLIGLLLWFLFLWKEGKSALVGVSIINTILSLLAIIALIGLYLRPVLRQPVNTDAMVILTRNYDKIQLDSLQRANKPLKVIQYKEGENLTPFLTRTSVAYILGDGLRKFDLWQFDSIPAWYRNKEKPLGLLEVKFKKEHFIGDSLRVAVRYNAANDSRRLVLSTANQKGLDSVVIKASQNTTTSLSVPIKMVGKYVYKLIEKDTAGKILNSEPIPIVGIAKEPLHILMINSFPTFESKYLKNYLSKGGHSVTLRSQITKGTYRFEYYNTARNPVYNFTRKNLNAFHIIFIDAASYTRLSSSSMAALLKAVEDDGLGLFIVPDDIFFTKTSSDINLSFTPFKRGKTHLQNWPKASVNTYPFRFAAQQGLESIVQSKADILNAYTRRKRGRIGTTLVQNTYQWQLDGQELAYETFWANTLTALAKRHQTN